ncbi:hypothetical protein [Pedobacter psychrophilus]|nr:hypothetical protein [Pedobacter psychrophilus]
MPCGTCRTAFGNKRIRGIYNGTLELEAQQLVKDIKTLEKE